MIRTWAEPKVVARDSRSTFDASGVQTTAQINNDTRPTFVVERDVVNGVITPRDYLVAYARGTRSGALKPADGTQIFVTRHAIAFAQNESSDQPWDTLFAVPRPDAIKWQFYPQLAQAPGGNTALFYYQTDLASLNVNTAAWIIGTLGGTSNPAAWQPALPLSTPTYFEDRDDLDEYVGLAAVPPGQGGALPGAFYAAFSAMITVDAMGHRSNGHIAIEGYSVPVP